MNEIYQRLSSQELAVLYQVKILSPATISECIELIRLDTWGLVRRELGQWHISESGTCLLKWLSASATKEQTEKVAVASVR